MQVGNQPRSDKCVQRGSFMDWECAAGIRRPPRNRYYISSSWEPSAVCSFTWSERPSARYVMFAQVARFVFIAVHITSDHCRVKDDKTNVFFKNNLKRRGNRRIDFIAMIDGKVSRNECGWVDERERWIVWLTVEGRVGCYPSLSNTGDGCIHTCFRKYWSAVVLSLPTQVNVWTREKERAVRKNWN